MATAKNAKIEIETGQSLSGATYSAMTDSGDHQIYTVSGGTLWSGKSGKTPIVRPNGIVSGRNLVGTATSTDYVSVAAFTAYSKGTLYTVTAANIAVDRASTGNKKIDSITMTSAGALAVVQGTESSGAFVSTRNAAGGPPLIPVNSVEIGQVYLTGATAAVVDIAEIYQVVGQHTERYDYPTWQEYQRRPGRECGHQRREIRPRQVRRGAPADSHRQRPEDGLHPVLHAAVHRTDADHGVQAGRAEPLRSVRRNTTAAASVRFRPASGRAGSRRC